MISRICNISKSQSFFLFGPRGSGKSTLLKSIFDEKDALWINLLDQKMEFTLANDPDALLDLWKLNKNKWIVIDEVQKIPRLLDVVHRGIEDYKIKFALTGSSSRKLKRGSANMLANRAASYLLSPFSAIELNELFVQQKALSYGLLPKYWDENEPLDSKEISRSLYSYVQTYLKEEVAAEQLVRDLNPFRRFLVSAAQSNTQIINYAKIEKDAGIASGQAQRHFEILTDTLIGRYLEPFDTSIRKRQSQKSKFYFFDTGVVRTLNNLVEEPLIKSTYEYGNIFETFIVNEFFKLIESFEKRWKLSYLKTQGDVEIDLIIEKPRGLPILIEIKSSDKIKPSDVPSFIKIAKDIKFSRALVLSNTETEWLSEGVQALHWQKGLKEIFEL
ncbi:MAG: ATP-binding protein [Bdellovibrionaceae bacterium]|nr:ATP-binding protein [Pseudobdellovibrionaceae bacterium]